MEILSFLLAPFWIKRILVKRVNSCRVVFVLAVMLKLLKTKKRNERMKKQTLLSLR